MKGLFTTAIAVLLAWQVHADSVKSEHTVNLSLNGKVSCYTDEFNTGYLPQLKDFASLSVADLQLGGLLKLTHLKATALRPVGLCNKIAALGAGVVELKVEVEFSTFTNKANPNKVDVLEALKVKLPNGVVLSSSVWAQQDIHQYGSGTRTTESKKFGMVAMEKVAGKTFKFTSNI